MSDIVLLNDLKFDGVINLPVFSINYLPSDIDLSLYDALIFTSKNAIMAIDSFNSNWKKLPSYCIAPKTADVVNQYKGKIAFVGESSHGNSFAKELIPLLKNQQALYVRAKKTVSSLKEILCENEIKTDELIAYETTCNQQIYPAPKENSIIIFSAPSTVQCFFDKYEWKSSYKAIVIGKTTAKYMPKEIEYLVSQVQSVESCIKLARTL